MQVFEILSNNILASLDFSFIIFDFPQTIFNIGSLGVAETWLRLERVISGFFKKNHSFEIIAELMEFGPRNYTYVFYEKYISLNSAA